MKLIWKSIAALFTKTETLMATIRAFMHNREVDRLKNDGANEGFRTNVRHFIYYRPPKRLKTYSPLLGRP